MMEIPNNAKAEEIMDFKKFAKSKKGLMYSDDKVFIEGKYKEDGSEEIYEGDDFLANKVFVSGEPINAEIIYRTYLEWFNYTLRPGEKERLFVSANIKENNDAKSGEREQ
ncbi:MAG: hypothetical protein ACLKAN_13555 [Alkaliphilus sp.]